MKRKYVVIRGKGFERSKYIKRYFHLLNIIEPDRFELITWNIDAEIYCKESEMSVVHFTGNVIDKY